MGQPLQINMPCKSLFTLEIRRVGRAPAPPSLYDLRTGYVAFDKQFFVRSNNEKLVLEFLKPLQVRQAIWDLFGMGYDTLTCDGDNFTVKWEEFSGAGAPSPEFINDTQRHLDVLARKADRVDVPALLPVVEYPTRRRNLLFMLFLAMAMFFFLT